MTPVTPSSVCDMQGDSYRKKPVVIKATQYTAAVRDAHLFDKQPLPAGVRIGASNTHPGRREVYRADAYIQTLEGCMEVSLGDWVITGVKGEHYPCKPDIFAATYESAALAERTPQSDVQSLIQKYGTRNPANRNGPDGWFLDDEAMRLIGAERTQQEAQPEAVGVVDGDDMSRRILWSDKVAAFDYPVGTKLYTRTTSAATAPMQPSEAMDAEARGILDRLEYQTKRADMWMEKHDALEKALAAPTQAAGGEAVAPSDVEILHLARFHAIDHRYWSQTRVLQFARDVIAAAAPAAAVEPPYEVGQATLREAVQFFFDALDRHHDTKNPPAKYTVPWGAVNALRATLTAFPAAAAPEGLTAHPDDEAVDRFAAAMKEKLAAARAKGRSGWDDPKQCTTIYLSELLLDHIAKGDPVDVANFAMMLHQRGSRIESEAAIEVWRMPATPDAKTAEERKALTDEQVLDEASHFGFLGDREQLVKFVRAIEREHGIGDQP